MSALAMSHVESAGTIMAVPGAGPGIVLLNGEQLPFLAQGVWSSEAPPTLHQMVLVEQDGSGVVVKLTLIDSEDIELAAPRSGFAPRTTRSTWQRCVSWLRRFTTRSGT
ncbi:MAG: hypothetical protein ABW217_18135 [Polyangiaceae bacterium]